MKFISLFSGIGGFDLGFERSGLECVAQVENNAAASSVLARHYPRVERFEDVRHVGRHNLPAAVIVCGGFPCQDVSVAGNRAGLAGSRSGLWFEFLRILTELKPRWCVIENVPGLLSSNNGGDFAAIVHGLVECGYRVCWRVLDAQHFGVAQRRRRVFIVGSLGDGRSAEILFEREGSARHSEPRIEAGQGTAATASGSAASRSFNEQRSDQYADASVDATLASRDGKGVRTVVTAKPLLAKSGSRNNGGDENFLITAPLSASGAGTARTGNERNEAEMLIAVRTNNGTAHGHGVLDDGTVHTLGGSTDAIAFNWNAGAKAGLSDGALAPTLRTGHHNHPGVSAPFGVRRLTPTECERLQGFPDGWTEGQSDSARYTQLGNAVCVNVSQWLGERLAVRS